MAGSLNHIVDNDGQFTIDLIDDMGDAYEALEECFHIVHRLTQIVGRSELDRICDELNYPRVSVESWPRKE